MTIFKKAAALTLVLGSLAAAAPAAAQDKIVWRFHTSHSQERDVFAAQADWADSITKATNGRLEVKVYPGGALGFKDADMLGALKAGLVETSFVYGGYYARDEPAFPVIMPQMVFNSREEMMRIFPTAYKMYQELYNEWGIHLSTMWPTLTCNVATIGKTKFGSIADMKGKRIRVWEAQQIDTLKKLGVAAVVIPQNDLYLALKTGTLDGAVHFPDALKDLSLAEDAKYFSLMQPAPVAQAIGISKKALDALPEDLRRIVNEVSEAHRKKWEAESGACKAEKEKIAWALSQGVQQLPDFSAEDRAAISKAAVEVWRERAELAGAKASKYQKAMEEALMKARATP